MRILHLISSSGLFGAEMVLLELARAQKKFYRYEPVVGVIENRHNPHTELADAAKKCGLKQVIFPCKGQFDLKLVSQIKSFIYSNKINIVHCHGYKSNFFGLLASMGRIPAIATNHNWLRSHWKLKLYCLLDSILIRFFDKIVAVSEGVKIDMINYMVPGDKIKIINNGVDLERFDITVSNSGIKNEFGIRDSDKVVVIIGSLGPEKGHQYFLQAARIIIETGKAVKFLIVGDGPLRRDLEHEALELGLIDKIIFTGVRNDIPEILSSADIFTISSVKEGLPMVLLEAMACRKPVVATSVGAIPTVIEHGINGMLVLPQNVEELADAIDELLLDDKKARTLALEGYRTVEKYYSAQTMCNNYIKLYHELVPGKA